MIFFTKKAHYYGSYVIDNDEDNDDMIIDN